MQNWDLVLNSCEMWKEAVESDEPHLQHLKKINPKIVYGTISGYGDKA